MRPSRKGSVLMEMIVVFPIYLVIFGGLFMLGDMLIKVARLPSAERSVAFELGGGTFLRDEIGEYLYPADREVNDERHVADLIEADDTAEPATEDAEAVSISGTSEYYADTAIEGPFSLRAAVKLKDGYYLPGGGTRGQLAFADWFFTNTVGAAQMTGDMATLISGAGRIYLRSKDNSQGRVRYYNYYTLKRNRNYDGSNWRANKRWAGDLLADIAGHAQHWDDVYTEKFHYDGENEDDGTNEANRASDKAGDSSGDYERYGQFVTWSD